MAKATELIAASGFAPITPHSDSDSDSDSDPHAHSHARSDSRTHSDSHSDSHRDSASVGPPRRGRPFGLLARDELRDLLQALRRRHWARPSVRLVLTIQEAALVVRIRGRL